MYYSDNNRVVAAIFYVTFILIGNYIFLNLFLAVLIDSFLKEGETSANHKQIEQSDQMKQDEMIEMLKTTKKAHKKQMLKNHSGKTGSSMFLAKRGTVT
jgi:hypothetical protein